MLSLSEQLRSISSVNSRTALVPHSRHSLAATACAWTRKHKQNRGLGVYLVETALKQLAQRIVRTGLPRNSPSRNQLVHADFDIATAEPLSLRPSRLVQAECPRTKPVRWSSLPYGAYKHT